MPNGDDGLFVSGTKDDKKKDPRDTQQNENIKATLDSVSNEVNLLLMDQKMPEEEKQIVTDILTTVSMTKESTNQSQTEEVDGELMNDQIIDNGVQETEEQQGNGLLNEQLGEQMSVKVDVAQPSFEVQQVPQAPAPAHRKNGFFRFIKSVMSLITGCVIVKRFAKWKHGDRSREALAAAKQKADQIAVRVNEHKAENEQGGQAIPQQEAYQGEQNLDILKDQTKVPIIWEQPLGYGEQAPTVEAHTIQDEDRSRSDGGGININSFIVLRYSKKDYRTDKQRRYRLAFGFNRRLVQDRKMELGLNVTTPGELVNLGNGSSSVGRSYSITNDQVNTILNQATKEADMGYNLIKHNCTTFVVNLLRSAGVADGGLKEEYIDLGGQELLQPAYKVNAVRRLGEVRDGMLGLMDYDDEVYGREGKKLVSYEDIERFENSIDYDSNELVGFAPGMLGMQLRNLNLQDGDNSNTVGINNMLLTSNNKDMRIMRSKLSGYEDKYKGQGKIKVNQDLFTHINNLVIYVNELKAPLLKETSPEARQRNAATIASRRKVLANTTGFDKTKNHLLRLAKEWLNSLGPDDDVDYQSIGQGMIAALEAAETGYYEAHNEQLLNNVGIKDSDTDMYYALAPTNALNYNVDSNPLFLKCFAKIFGSESYSSYFAKKQEMDRKIRLNLDYNISELSIMKHKYSVVMDYYKAEQYKLRQLTNQPTFTQEQTNNAFAQQPQAEKYDQAIQDANAMIILNKLFPSSRSSIMAEIADYKLLPTKGGKKSISIKDCCGASKSILDMVAKGIESDENGLFESIVRAIAYNGGAKLPQANIKKSLLDSIFNKYFYNITEGTLIPVSYLAGLADLSKLSQKAKKDGSEEYNSMMEGRENLISKIDEVIERVLKNM